MTTLIEDFSTKVQMVNPSNDYRYTDFVQLEVMEWSGEDCLIAYTFNSDTENTAKQLFKALVKYNELKFVTGVTGHTKNRLIQELIKAHMERLYWDKIEVTSVGDDYKYRMK